MPALLLLILALAWGSLSWALETPDDASVYSAAAVEDALRMPQPAQPTERNTAAEEGLDSSTAPFTVQKLDQRDPVPATWNIRYTVFVTNTSEVGLSNVVLTDTLPSGTFFLSADVGAAYSGGEVTWAIPHLDPGSGAQLHLTLGTFSALRGVITNTVTASAAGTTVMTDTETTTIIDTPPTPTPTLTSAHSPTPTPTHTATPSPSNTPTQMPTQTRPPGQVPTPTGTFAALPTWAGTATPPWPTPTPFSGEPPSTGLPPVIFVMLDWMNGDWANPDYSYSYVDKWGHWEEVRGHPEYGALGGWAEFYWDELNPGKGYYRWTKIDEYIKRAQAMQVRLPDGRLIAKPVGIGVATWVMDESPYRIGTNRTPGWVASEAGGRTTSCYDPDGPWGTCKPFCTPLFSNEVWQYWFDQFIIAMGERYDNNPEFHNLAFVVIATGADGETNERKDAHGCDYHVGNSPAFNDWVQHVMQTYNLAFPTTPQFVQSTIHGIHYDAQLAASFPSRMTGVKVGGLKVDVPDAEVRYDHVLVGGVTGFSTVWHPVIPTGFEPKHANGIEGSYWFFMEGLSTHPYMFDIQLPNIHDAYLAEQRTGFPILDFVRTHLSKTVHNTPDVWIVLRETYGRNTCWTGSDGIYRCYGPHHGDFDYWLYRSDAAPGSRTVALLGNRLDRQLPREAREHTYGWHSTRRTDQGTGNPYMSFDIDDRYGATNRVPRAAGGQAAWTISVTFVNHGADSLSLEYLDYYGNLVEHRIVKGPGLGPQDNWVDYTWYVENAYFDNGLPGGMDFRLDCNNDGNEVVHRLIVTAQRP